MKCDLCGYSGEVVRVELPSFLVTRITSYLAVPFFAENREKVQSTTRTHQIYVCKKCINQIREDVTRKYFLPTKAALDSLYTAAGSQPLKLDLPEINIPYKELSSEELWDYLNNMNEKSRYNWSKCRLSLRLNRYKIVPALHSITYIDIMEQEDIVVAKPYKSVNAVFVGIPYDSYALGSKYMQEYLSKFSVVTELTRYAKVFVFHRMIKNYSIPSYCIHLDMQSKYINLFDTNLLISQVKVLESVDKFELFEHIVKEICED